MKVVRDNQANRDRWEDGRQCLCPYCEAAVVLQEGDDCEQDHYDEWNAAREAERELMGEE